MIQDKIITIESQYWVLERRLNNEIILIQFETAELMSNYLENQEVYFGEQGQEYKNLGESMNSQELECHVKQEKSIQCYDCDNLVSSAYLCNYDDGYIMTKIPLCEKCFQERKQEENKQ